MTQIDIIGLDKGLLPAEIQTIIWNKAGLSLISLNWSTFNQTTSKKYMLLLMTILLISSFAVSEERSYEIYIYPVFCPKLTLIQPTWSAYLYHLVFLIWYPYSLVFLIWYPYALISLYGNTAHCSGCGIAMGCYGLSIVPRTAIATSQWYDRYCFTR